MAWHSWTPPSLADVLGPGTVRCPTCGRFAGADMCHDIAALPAAVRARWKRGATATHACDGCRETLFREGVIHPAEYARFLGAPEAVALKLEQKRRDLPALPDKFPAELVALRARRGF